MQHNGDPVINLRPRWATILLAIGAFIVIGSCTCGLIMLAALALRELAYG